MICPNCKCDPKQYKDRVIVNIGGKEKYDAVDYRRYVCLECGYRWMTEEVFSREVEVKKKEEVCQ